MEEPALLPTPLSPIFLSNKDSSIFYCTQERRTTITHLLAVNSQCSNNSRDTWKTLNSLIRYKNTSKDIILNHNGSTVSDPSTIAEVFNNYILNGASNLDRNIPDSNISPLNFLIAPVENSFFCAPSDREEIVNLIHRQKNKSTDLMNIPVFIYKILAPIISPTVSMLFNNSLSESIFLNALKQLKLFSSLNLVTQILL